MEQVVEVCYKIARALQIGGGGVAAVSLGIAGYKFIAGGRNAKEIGKEQVIGTCLGLGCVGGCEALAKWLESLMTF